MDRLSWELNSGKGCLIATNIIHLPVNLALQVVAKNSNMAKSTLMMSNFHLQGFHFHNQSLI